MSGTNRDRTNLDNSSKALYPHPPQESRPSFPNFRRLPQFRTIIDSAYEDSKVSRIIPPPNIVTRQSDEINSAYNISRSPSLSPPLISSSPLPNFRRRDKQNQNYIVNNRYNDVKNSVNTNQSFTSPNASYYPGNSQINFIDGFNNNRYNDVKNSVNTNQSFTSPNASYYPGNSQANFIDGLKTFKSSVLPRILPPIKSSPYSSQGTLATIAIALRKNFIKNLLKETPEKANLLYPLPEESYIITNIIKVPVVPQVPGEKNKTTAERISELNTIPPIIERDNSAKNVGIKTKLIFENIEIPEIPDVIINLDKHFTNLFPIENNIIGRNVEEYNNTVTFILKSVFDVGLNTFKPNFAYVYVERPTKINIYNQLHLKSIYDDIKAFIKNKIIKRNDLLIINSFFSNTMYIKFSSNKLSDFDNKYVVIALCTLDYKTTGKVEKPYDRNNFTNIYVNRNILNSITTPNEYILSSSLSGNSFTKLYQGGKSIKKLTKKNIIYKNKRYSIYKGSKGGEYIKLGLNVFKNIKNLN